MYKTLAAFWQTTATIGLVSIYTYKRVKWSATYYKYKITNKLPHVNFRIGWPTLAIVARSCSNLLRSRYSDSLHSATDKYTIYFVL